MNKKIWCLALVSMLGYFNTRGQGFSLGIRGGISVPDLSAGGSQQNPLNSGYSSRLGPDFGILGEYGVSGLFSVEAVVEYSSQGGKKDGMQAFPNPEGGQPQYLYANFNSQAELNYLMIPVLAKFGWDLGSGSPWRFYVDAGPFLGILLSANQVTSGSSIVYADPQGTEPVSPDAQSFNNKDNIKSQLNTINFGIDANIGLAYRFNGNSVFIEGGGNYGFLNIQKGTQNGQNDTGAATALIGFSHQFGK